MQFRTFWFWSLPVVTNFQRLLCLPMVNAVNIDNRKTNFNVALRKDLNDKWLGCKL